MTEKIFTSCFPHFFAAALFPLSTSPVGDGGISYIYVYMYIFNFTFLKCAGDPLAGPESGVRL
jgi:uncharacterized membrane protein